MYLYTRSLLPVDLSYYSYYNPIKQWTAQLNGWLVKHDSTYQSC